MLTSTAEATKPQPVTQSGYRRELRVWRERTLALLPWLRRLPPGGRCAGYRWSQVPLYAVGKPALMERWRCRNEARWHFTAWANPRVGGSWDRRSGTTGDYCLTHLVIQQHDYPAEQARIDRWFARHPNVLDCRPVAPDEGVR